MKNLIIIIIILSLFCCEQKQNIRKTQFAKENSKESSEKIIPIRKLGRINDTDFFFALHCHMPTLSHET